MNLAPIPEFKPEDFGPGKTPLSAERMNQIIRVFNSFANIQAGTGIKITKSDGRIIIELDS